MTKEAMKLALDALIVCRQSNYGRNWCWPDTAIKTALNNVFEAIEALEEALKQEQDKPVATLIEHYAFTDGIVRFDGVENMEQLPVGTKLYTTLQQRNPLTDEEIIAKCEYMPDYDIGNHDLIRFARAIEAAHGIKD